MSDNSRYINGPYTCLRQTKNFITRLVLKLLSCEVLHKWIPNEVELKSENTNAKERLQMRRILLTNEAWW